MGRCRRYVLLLRCFYTPTRCKGKPFADNLADAVAKEAANDRGSASTSYARPSARASRPDREVEDEEDEHTYEGDGIVADDDDEDDY